MNLSSGLKYSRRQVVLGAFGVAAILGLIILVLSRASGNNQAVEAESFSLTGATTVQDSNASGGSAIVFGSTTPPPPPPPPSACVGPAVPLTGTTTAKYTNASPAAGTTFNLTGWFSNAVTGQGASQAFDIGGSSVPAGLCVIKGVVNGHIDPALDWRTVHDAIGGFGYRISSTGLASVDSARIHNVEDGWKPRECSSSSDSCPTYVNKGVMMMKNTYMTGIRDDSIENDDFLPGDIQDSLFDGVHTFLSEQQQGSTGSGVGSGEDPNIRVTRVYVRLYPTNAQGADSVHGAGKWFKWQGSTSHHNLIVTDSVFAVDAEPRGGWGNLSIPAGTQWVGSNFILWLGTPGGYGGPKPAGVTFIEGQAAKDKWNAVRNPWLTSHGYQAKAVDDFNPMDDPVVAPS